MRIIVAIKQTPDPTKLRVSKSLGTVVTAGVPLVLNPADKNALEAALALRDQHGGEVIALTMGSAEADDVLREAIAMGADEGYLLSDPAFAGADAWSTVTVLGKAIQKIGEYDLILTGSRSTDGEAAQVGAQLAEFLDLSQVTFVRQIEVKDGKLVAKKQLSDGYATIESTLPALLTIVRGANKPRYPHLGQAMTVYKEGKVTVWGAADVGADPSEVGEAGALIQVRGTTLPPDRVLGEKITGDPTSAARELVSKLKSRNLL
jgi:electron transfer flavoprotein beta subunit